MGCEHTLLAHVQFCINHHCQVLLHRVALNQSSVQPVGVSGIAMIQCRTVEEYIWRRQLRVHLETGQWAEERGLELLIICIKKGMRICGTAR